MRQFSASKLSADFHFPDFLQRVLCATIIFSFHPHLFDVLSASDAAVALIVSISCVCSHLDVSSAAEPSLTSNLRCALLNLYKTFWLVSFEIENCLNILCLNSGSMQSMHTNYAQICGDEFDSDLELNTNNRSANLYFSHIFSCTYNSQAH